MDPFERDLKAAIPAVRRYAAHLTRNPDAADDLTQDTLLNAWAARASFIAGTNIEGWLATICRNLFINTYRYNARRPTSPDADLAVIPAPTRPHDTVIDVTRFLPHMPATLRDSVLAFAAGYTHEEAAAAAAIPIPTSKTRLHHARAFLARHGLDNCSDV